MVGNVKTRAIGTALAAHFVGQGMTQAQVATKYDISQSWVGRIYHGEFGERSKTVRRMCKEVGIPFMHNEVAGLDHETTNYRLLRLLESVWNGTEEDAVKLTAALLAIKKLSVLSERKSV